MMNLEVCSHCEGLFQKNQMQILKCMCTISSLCLYNYFEKEIEANPNLVTLKCPNNKCNSNEVMTREFMDTIR